MPPEAGRQGRMPSSFLSHASVLVTKDKLQPKDDVTKKCRGDPALCPTDSNVIAPKRRAPEKRSLDYV